MSNKKSGKKEEQRMKEIQLAKEEQLIEEERQKKEGRLKELAQKSAPLADYGLLDSYQFFLSQLASSGIPQGNIYEFAAQSLLKYEKNKNKKLQTLKEVEQANQQAVKVVSENIQSKSRPRMPRQLKPQLLPFKGQVSEEQKQFLSRK